MKPSITEIQNEIVEEFELFDDWTDRYTYIIELGKKLNELDPKYKVPENIIKGCQSNVWLHAYVDDSNDIIYETDSDAMIVRGLVYLLVRTLSGHQPEEIMNADLFFIDKIGMTQHLSPTRSNGLAAMVKQMKLYALAFQAK